MIKKVKIKCGRCGRINRVFVGDLSRKIDHKSEDKKVLCINCCNSLNFYSKFCEQCMDLDVCNKSLKDKYNQWLSGIKGI